ncbi:MAG: hypothetical protein EBZ67_10830 [Chitinophagia bacterium]|nr:hypothetical protein [Chitinophagia bacterium]
MTAKHDTPKLPILKRAAASVMLLLALHAHAQPPQNGGFFGNASRDERACPRSSNFMSEEDVNRLVSEMLGRIGAMNRYIVMGCTQVENCQATVVDGRPYILYNPQFLQSVRRLDFSSKQLPTVQAQDWETLTILAHELGHHINNHLTNPLPGATAVDMELEADRSAGFMIYLMGGSLAQASSAYAQVSEKGGYTHPGRPPRLEALRKGYEDAAMRYPRTVTEPKPVVQPVVKEPVRPPVSGGKAEPVRVTLQDDPSIPASPPRLSNAEEKSLYKAKQAFFRRDCAVALEELRSARLKDVAEAQYYLAYMHEQECGVARDYRESLRLYRISAAQGFAMSMQALGRIYQMGYGVVERDFAESARWNYMGAVRGSATCMSELGAKFLFGTGVSRDPEEAIKWLRLAVDKGHHTASYHMGQAYELGIGVEKDMTEAIRWYRRAAEGGSSIAKERLSKLEPGK